MIFGWTPEIGDPTIYGWLTVVAYFGAAYLCHQCVQASITRCRPGGGAVTVMIREKRFWVATAILLGLLGINKQLDLQTLLTDIGRVIAKSGGWYDSRQVVQRAFILSIGIITLAAIVLCLGAYRRARWQVMLALCGIICLLAFVVIRAASFHHIDIVLRSGISGFRVNHLMELGGISVIGLSALSTLRQGT